MLCNNTTDSLMTIWVSMLRFKRNLRQLHCKFYVVAMDTYLHMQNIIEEGIRKTNRPHLIKKTYSSWAYEIALIMAWLSTLAQANKHALNQWWPSSTKQICFAVLEGLIDNVRENVVASSFRQQLIRILPNHHTWCKHTRSDCLPWISELNVMHSN